MEPNLDIVLPCYNPTSGWVDLIIESYVHICLLLPEIDIKLILVNDGSINRIAAADIFRLQKNIVKFEFIDLQENRGKGAALRTGVKVSKAPYCIYTDIDFPYANTSLVEIFNTLKSDEADIAIGIKDPDYYSHLPWFRIQVSHFLRFLVRSFLKISITDTQCGLKGFNAKGKEIFLRTTIKRYLADLEFIFLADRESEVRMISKPITLKPGVVFSKVNLGILFSEGLNFMKVFFNSLLRRA